MDDEASSSDGGTLIAQQVWRCADLGWIVELQVDSAGTLWTASRLDDSPLWLLDGVYTADRTPIPADCRKLALDLEHSAVCDQAVFLAVQRGTSTSPWPRSGAPAAVGHNDIMPTPQSWSSTISMTTDPTNEDILPAIPPARGLRRLISRYR